MIIHIYGLYSTENNIIRYVGQTKNKLKQRLNEHKCDALTRQFNNHKCHWIRQVYNNGYEIGITLLEDVDETNWEEKEIYWINKLKESNQLVNHLKGGNCGGPGGKLQNFISYQDAKDIIKSQLSFLTSQPQYFKFAKENPEIFANLKLPKAPMEVYTLRNEWISWGDYLGTNRIASIQKKHKID